MTDLRSRMPLKENRGQHKELLGVSTRMSPMCKLVKDIELGKRVQCKNDGFLVSMQMEWVISLKYVEFPFPLHGSG
jgi:hypothetical protein